MPLPVSPNAISLNNVNIELRRTSGSSINMNDSDLRFVFGRTGSGTQISMSDGHGKSYILDLTIIYSGTYTTETFGNPVGSTIRLYNQNLRSLYDASVYAGITSPALVRFTVKTGTVIGSTKHTSSDKSHYSIRTGTWTGTTLYLVVESGAFIVGRGGDAACGGNGTHGGPAILLEHNTTSAVQITNNGTIGGGGGCGAGAPIGRDSYGGAGGAGDYRGTNPSGIRSACSQSGCYQSRTGTPGTTAAGGAPYNSGCTGQRGGNLGQAGFGWNGGAGGGGACGYGIVQTTSSYTYTVSGNAISGTCVATTYVNGTGGA
jgi:hypothetical protein